MSIGYVEFQAGHPRKLPVACMQKLMIHLCSDRLFAFPLLCSVDKPAGTYRDPMDRGFVIRNINYLTLDRPHVGQCLGGSLATQVQRTRLRMAAMQHFSRYR